MATSPSAASDRLSRLLVLLYEGVSTPQQMPVFLTELVQTLSATGAVFREHTFSTSRAFQVNSTDLAETVGYSDEALQSYQTWWGRDIYLQRCLERFHTADCGVSQVLATKTELQHNDFWTDYMERFDVGPMIWAKLAERSDYHASISIVRANKAELFGQPELELLTALSPHLRQALQMSRTLHNLQTSNAMLSQSVEEMGIAICMVRQDASILRSTEAANHLLSAQDGICVKGGRLQVTLDQEHRLLDALIAGACQTTARSGLQQPIRTRSNAAGAVQVRTWTARSGGGLLITRRLSRPLQVVVSPFCPGTLLPEPEATALIQFSDPSSIPKSRAAVLAALYSLTPTESRFADLLLRGLEVREAADRMRITFETARYHLKRILAKTGTGRQTELMRLMLSLPGQ